MFFPRGSNHLPGSQRASFTSHRVAPAAVLSLTALLSAPAIGLAAPQNTTLVSVTSSGVQANGRSTLPRITPDARYVAFVSEADNLGVYVSDLIVRDLVLGTTTDVSAGAGSGDVTALSISPDGRYVAFTRFDCAFMGCVGWVYRRDLQSGTSTLVSLTHAGVPPAEFFATFEGAALAADGSAVAFSTTEPDMVLGDTNGKRDIFVRDLVLATTTRISVSSSGAQGDGNSSDPSMSADGRFVAFSSLATTLVAGDTNAARDVFVHDRLLGTTVRVSVSSSGSQGLLSSNTGLPPESDQGRIASDGGSIVFRSNARDLVPVDNNAQRDILLRDLTSGTTELVNLSTSGAQANFDSGSPSVSPDGRFVAFSSPSTNLVAPDVNLVPDVFIRDRKLGATSIVSRAYDGVQANNQSYSSSVSASGRLVAFDSLATNLVSTPDTQPLQDVFLRDTGPTFTYCTAKTSSLGCVPQMQFTGTPSVSSPTIFDIGATQILNNKNGLLFYGPDAQSAPFQGGLLCVKPPIQRTGAQHSGGNPPPGDCSGNFGFDFNTRIQSGFDPLLIAGAEVACQYWYRDPQSPSTTGLTDAIWFTIEP